MFDEEVSRHAIDSREVVLGEIIGSGSFATVHKGIFECKSIAVKKPKRLLSELTSHDRRAVLREVKIAVTLHHDNVMKLLGYCMDSDCLLLLMELGTSSLHDILYNNDKVVIDKYCIALDIAEGLNYLHLKEIVHRDLSSKNIICCKGDGRFVAKIADFGLTVSRDLHSTLEVNGGGRIVGTFPYCAPELFISRNNSPASDMFAFGLLVNEMLSEKRPWEGVDPFVIMGNLLQRRRPMLHVPLDFMELTLMQVVGGVSVGCLCDLAENRPVAATVVARLKSMHLDSPIFIVEVALTRSSEKMFAGYVLSPNFQTKSLSESSDEANPIRPEIWNIFVCSVEKSIDEFWHVSHNGKRAYLLWTGQGVSSSSLKERVVAILEKTVAVLNSPLSASQSEVGPACTITCSTCDVLASILESLSLCKYYCTKISSFTKIASFLSKHIDHMLKIFEWDSNSMSDEKLMGMILETNKKTVLIAAHRLEPKIAFDLRNEISLLKNEFMTLLRPDGVVELGPKNFLVAFARSATSLRQCIWKLHAAALIVSIEPLEILAAEKILSIDMLAASKAVIDENAQPGKKHIDLSSVIREIEEEAYYNCCHCTRVDEDISSSLQNYCEVTYAVGEIKSFLSRISVSDFCLEDEDKVAEMRKFSLTLFPGDFRRELFAKNESRNFTLKPGLAVRDVLLHLCDHKNVCRYFQASPSLDEIEMEPVKMTLSHYLHDPNSSLQLSKSQILLDVASGLKYLHFCGIAHGSLTSKQLFLTRIKQEGMWTVKIGGLRDSVNDTDYDDSEAVNYLPPEGPSCTPASDIYAYGVMCKALFGLQAEVKEAETRRPTSISVFDQAAVEIIGDNSKGCLCSVPENRPTAKKCYQDVLEERKKAPAYLEHLSHTLRGGNTRLHAAAKEGRLEIVRHLVETDPRNELHSLNDIGSTPAHLAAEFGHLDLLKYLLNLESDEYQAVLVYQRNKDNDDLFDLSVRGNHEEIVQYLQRNWPRTRSELERLIRVANSARTAERRRILSLLEGFMGQFDSPPHSLLLSNEQAGGAPKLIRPPPSTLSTKESHYSVLSTDSVNGHYVSCCSYACCCLQ